MNHSIVIDFLSQARHCKSVEELGMVAQKAFELLGFPMWAYQTETETLLEKPEPIIVHNFPKKWENYYISNNCSDIDPIVVHGKEISSPFRWSKLTQHVQLSKSEIEFQHIAREHSMKDGIAIPLVGGNGRIAMLSLTSDVENSELNKIFTDHSDKILAISFAFHSIAKDLIKDQTLSITGPTLTEREQECMLWTAKSKSSWEIGKILGISERTVVFHIENAKKKFGVTSKYHLIVRAIAEGYIKI